MIVLGIDPGSRCTGYGVVQEISGQLSLLDTGTIRPAVDSPLSQRLGRIFAGIEEVIGKFKPLEAAVEDVFFARNSASALKLGQARGAAIASCARMGLSVTDYSPTEVKKSVVGAGRADKSQVAFMVCRILGEKGGWAKDSSDALAVAICHLNHRRLNAYLGKVRG